MPKYMVVYLVKTDWSFGTEANARSSFFDKPETVAQFCEDVWNFYPDVTDLQWYEYTGIQYVLVERRHKDV